MRDKNIGSFVFKEVTYKDIFDIINNEGIDENVIVFGNLPYNISTKILASFVMFKKWPPWYDILIFMYFLSYLR